MEDLRNYIYSSVPKDVGQDNEDYEDRIKILHLLMNHKDMFITAFKIAKVLGFNTKGTQVETRLMITRLLEIDKQPIVSGAKGFAYVSNPEKIKSYAESLILREKGLMRRIKAVNDVYNKMLYFEEHGGNEK